MQNRTSKHLFFVLISILLISSLLKEVRAESFELSKSVNASTLLEPSLLKGKIHSVDEHVDATGYMYRFKVHSDNSEFTALSRPFLEKRVSEVYMIALIREKFPSTDVVYEAGKETAITVVKAPIDGAKKAYDTISDQEKLEKTAKSIPGGVVNLFAVAGKAIETDATAVYKVGSQALNNNEENASGEDSPFSITEPASDAVSFAGGLALKYIGYTKSYMKVAEAIKADPYTENGELRWEMKRVASLQATVNVAGIFAPGIPYAATVNKYSKYAEEIALYEDPEKVDELNRKVLDALSKVENFGGDEKSNRLFLDNEHYSPVMKQIVIAALKKLDGVSDLGSLLQSASRAGSREIARFFMAAIVQLAEAHNAENSLRTVVREIILPAAVSTKGRLIVLLPVDHILWTAEVAKIFRTSKEKIYPEYDVESAEIRVAGTLSERSKKEFVALGIDSIKTNVGY